MGLFKTLMIIIGVFVLLRFLGQLMNARRNMEEERSLNARQRNIQKERSQKLRDFGKTHVKKSTDDISDNSEDVDFEEVD
ncbi:MAG: hypothetical protein MK066_11740 [Crocinitomicaceae bacterium]|nr:hypothetical protein [Crocinitomicaceae bacterium]